MAHIVVRPSACARATCDVFLTATAADPSPRWRRAGGYRREDRHARISAGGTSCPVSVIVAGARTPIGRLLGGLKDLSAADLGGVAIKGALEKAGVCRRPGRLRDHGPGHPGRRRPDHRPPGRRQGRHPDERPLDHHQQGLPLRHQRDRAGRPADPRRRARDRRRRRHGVDDQGPAPAAEVAARASSTATPRWSTRWPTTRSTTSSPSRRWAS